MKTKPNLGYETLGVITLSLIYLIISFLSTNPLQFALIFLIGFVIFVFIFFGGSIILSIIFGDKFNKIIDRFNKSEYNKFAIHTIAFIIQETTFIFFTLFAAAGLATLFNLEVQLGMIFFYPLAYLLVSIWSKIAVKFFENYLVHFIFFGFIGAPIIFGFIIPDPFKIPIIFITSALGGAPFWQFIVDQGKERLFEKHFKK